MNFEKYTQKAQGAVLDCQNIAVREGNQQVDRYFRYGNTF